MTSAPKIPKEDAAYSASSTSVKRGYSLLPPFQAGTTSSSPDVHHASPIAPLRPRDGRALDNFFESDRIQEIALDIHRYLARAYPEPCWEDEPYEFLRGYI